MRSSLCADAVSWDRDPQTSQRPTGVWSGGTGGTERTLRCPAFHFVVGLNVSAWSLIVGAALRHVERFFLRRNPKRRTTRHIVGTLTRLPVVSTARVYNSSKVASGCSFTSRRTCAWAAASKRGC
jgi:hypothetical protein